MTRKVCDSKPMFHGVDKLYFLNILMITATQLASCITQLPAVKQLDQAAKSVLVSIPGHC